MITAVIDDYDIISISLLLLSFCTALLSVIGTTMNNYQIQIPPSSQVEVIEGTLSLSALHPTVVIHSDVVGDGDILPVVVAVLPTLLSATDSITP